VAAIAEAAAVAAAAVAAEEEEGDADEIQRTAQRSFSA
jgi:hypothetical protein